jgi:hypothetical protein
MSASRSGKMPTTKTLAPELIAEVGEGDGE